MMAKRVTLIAAALTPFTLAAFAAWSLGGVSESDIPAAVVNEDTMLTTTTADGEEQTIFAGRQLVTDLTADNSDGFNWSIVNADDAADMFERGDVRAVLTIPSDFSKRVASLQTEQPQSAGIRIEADAKSDTVSAGLATEVGKSLTESFGDVVTTGFVTGVYSGYSDLSSELGGAADGAGEIGDGGDQLADGLEDIAGGLDGLASGAGDSATGAQELASGADQLADGADRLASGLGDAETGIEQLAGGAGGLRDGVVDYTTGVDRFADGVVGAAETTGDSLEQAQAAVDGVENLEGAVDQSSTTAGDLVQQLEADPTTDPRTLETAKQLEAGLLKASEADASGPIARGLGSLGTGLGDLSASASRLQARSQSLRDGAAQLAGGASALNASFGASVTGAQDLASGAAQLGAGGDQLAEGLTNLETGAEQLADGTRSAQTGAEDIAEGANELGEGLQEGADALPNLEEAEVSEISDVVAQPVVLEVARTGVVTSEARVASLAVPVALWFGGLAIPLALLPRGRASISSGASARRVLGTLLSRSWWLIAVQAVTALVVVHAMGGVSWTLAGSTLAAIAPFAFGAALIHIAFATLFGRFGSVVSIVLLGLQALVAPGVLPNAVIAEPFRSIGDWMPASQAAHALLSIAAGTGMEWGNVLALTGFAGLTVLAALWGIGVARRHAANERIAALDDLDSSPDALELVAQRAPAGRHAGPSARPTEPGA